MGDFINLVISASYCLLSLNPSLTMRELDSQTGNASLNYNMLTSVHILSSFIHADLHHTETPYLELPILLLGILQITWVEDILNWNVRHLDSFSTLFDRAARRLGYQILERYLKIKLLPTPSSPLESHHKHIGVR
jgi:hypothetical protein